MGSTHRVLGSMEDGRFQQNHRSACVLNGMLQKEFNVDSSDNAALRERLQSDGLRTLQRMHSEQPCGPEACNDLGVAIPQANLNASDVDVMPYAPSPSGTPLQFQ